MTIAELDGFVAALIVGPDMILPSEWLSGVWGVDHELTNGAEPQYGELLPHTLRAATERGSGDTRSVRGSPRSP